MKYTVSIGERAYEVVVEDGKDGAWYVTLGDQRYVVAVQQRGQEPFYAMTVDGELHQFYAEANLAPYDLLIEGELFPVEVLPSALRAVSVAADGASEAAGPLSVKAPMPGLVKELYVRLEQSVERGARLLVLEAMKMNNEIRAPRAGVLQVVAVTPGQRIDKGDLLVILA